MEEIIIDGVDVSGCELIYNDGRCFASQRQGIGYPCHKSDYCKYNPNCYYKQLKRRERELSKCQQILQEIKGIASKVCVSRCGCVCNHKEEILQKINEVEE